MKENDLEILKENTVDFVSLSYYNSRCVRADGKGEAAGGNVFASAKTRILPTVSGDGRSILSD